MEILVPATTWGNPEDIVVVQLLSHTQLFSQPHGLPHTEIPGPSLSPGVCFKLMSIKDIMLSETASHKGENTVSYFT